MRGREKRLHKKYKAGLTERVEPDRKRQYVIVEAIGFKKDGILSSFYVFWGVTLSRPFYNPEGLAFLAEGKSNEIPFK
jgi:hypothetical protein